MISDIGMPEMAGNVFITKWRVVDKLNAMRDIPANAVTAFNTTQERDLVLASGFHNAVPKPLDKVELLATIDRMGLNGIISSISDRSMSSRSPNTSKK